MDIIESKESYAVIVLKPESAQERRICDLIMKFSELNIGVAFIISISSSMGDYND